MIKKLFIRTFILCLATMSLVAHAESMEINMKVSKLSMGFQFVSQQGAKQIFHFRNFSLDCSVDYKMKDDDGEVDEGSQDCSQNLEEDSDRIVLVVDRQSQGQADMTLITFDENGRSSKDSIRTKYIRTIETGEKLYQMSTESNAKLAKSFKADGIQGSVKVKVLSPGYILISDGRFAQMTYPSFVLQMKAKQ